MLSRLLRNKEIGNRDLAIIPDEARTFGMDGSSGEIGIYSPKPLYDGRSRIDSLLPRSQRWQISRKELTKPVPMASSPRRHRLRDAGLHRFRFSFTTPCSASSASATRCGSPATSLARGFCSGHPDARPSRESLQHEDATASSPPAPSEVARLLIRFCLRSWRHIQTG